MNWFVHKDQIKIIKSLNEKVDDLSDKNKNLKSSNSKNSIELSGYKALSHNLQNQVKDYQEALEELRLSPHYHSREIAKKVLNKWDAKHKAEVKP